MTPLPHSHAAESKADLPALDNLGFSDEEPKDIDSHAAQGGIDLWRDQAMT